MDVILIQPKDELANVFLDVKDGSEPVCIGFGPTKTEAIQDAIVGLISALENLRKFDL